MESQKCMKTPYYQTNGEIECSKSHKVLKSKQILVHHPKEYQTILNRM